MYDEIVPKMLVQWREILSECIKEVRETDETFTSPALEQHIAGIGTLRIDLNRTHPELGVAVGMYVELLFQCQEQLNKKNRAGSLQRLRFLQDTWLPTFEEQLQGQKRAFSASKIPTYSA